MNSQCLKPIKYFWTQHELQGNFSNVYRTCIKAYTCYSKLRSTKAPKGAATVDKARTENMLGIAFFLFVMLSKKIPAFWKTKIQEISLWAGKFNIWITPYFIKLKSNVEALLIGSFSSINLHKIEWIFTDFTARLKSFSQHLQLWVIPVCFQYLFYFLTLYSDIHTSDLDLLLIQLPQVVL